MGMAIIIIIDSASIPAKDTGLSMAVQISQVGRLDHGVRRRNTTRSWREDCSEGIEMVRVLGPVLVWEFDVELDVEIAMVVVSLGGHSFATDHLDSTIRNSLSRKDLNTEPPVIEVFNIHSSTC